MPHSTPAKPDIRAVVKRTRPPMEAWDSPPVLGPCYINSLPCEILETIFSFAVVSQAEDTKWLVLGRGARNLDRQAAPFLLTSVCTHWRRIAIGYGALWSYISIPEPMTWSRGANAVEWLKFLLRRSRGAKLSVLLPWDDMREGEPEGCGTKQTVADCIDTLCAHSWRWARFEFRGPAHCFSNTIARHLFHTYTPALRHFWVSYDRGFDGREAAWAQPTSMLLNNTKLVAAGLILEHCAAFTQDMPHLRTVELDVPTVPTGLHTALARMPNLTHLTVTGIKNRAQLRTAPSPYTPPPRMEDRVPLKSLQSIHVLDGNSIHALDTLTHTTKLPNLTELRLPWTMGWHGGSVPALVLFLKEHGEQVTSLTFYEDRTQEWWDGLSDPLLRAVAGQSTTLLWDSLSQAGVDRKWLLPRLQVLRLERLNTFLWGDGAEQNFRKFDELRCNGRRGAFAALDVYWVQAVFPEECRTWGICACTYDMTDYPREVWCDLMEEGARARGDSEEQYFCSSTYLTAPPDERDQAFF